MKIVVRVQAAGFGDRSSLHWVAAVSVLTVALNIISWF